MGADGGYGHGSNLGGVYAVLRRSGGGGPGDASQAFGCGVRSGRGVRRGGFGWIEGEVCMHGEPVSAEVMDGLPGAASQVVIGLGQPEQIRLARYWFELLALQVPGREVGSNGCGGTGNHTVLGVQPEMEVGLHGAS
ncbi:hypothetical protein ACFVJ8_04260 [Streptomyces yangpuensis]|uniref:hypothetical protein n=1 Tax=Streptomyces yangpuensis TaxID=1648182 RepID=UPI00363F2F42